MITLRNKDLDGNDYIYEGLTEETEEELRKVGFLTPHKIHNEILYHLNLTYQNHYTSYIPRTKLSFAKGKATYGGTEGYWEAAVIKNTIVKGIMGYLEEEDILKYTSYIFTISKYDKWFEEMPFEFYRIRDFEKAKEIRDKIFSFNYPLLGRYGSLEV